MLDQQEHLHDKSLNQILGMLPEDFQQDLKRYEDDEAGQFELGVEQATRQVQELIDSGVPGVHFYVLNKSPATVKVLQSVTHAVQPFGVKR